MKKIFFTLLALTIIGLSCSKQQEISTPVVKSAIKKTRLYIKSITIVRGIDYTTDQGVHFHCIAGGPICEVYIEFGFGGGFTLRTDPPKDDTECFGGIARSEEGNLIMYFQKSTMSEEFTPYFNDGIMEMPQSKTIPLSIIEDLGFDSDYEIPAGNYGYTENDNYIIVNL